MKLQIEIRDEKLRETLRNFSSQPDREEESNFDFFKFAAAPPEKPSFARLRARLRNRPHGPASSSCVASQR